MFRSAISLEQFNTNPPPHRDTRLPKIASQYVDSLIAYQISDEPTLHDPNDPQYYLSTALCLLNFLTSSPDVCKRVATEPAIINGVIEKLLAPDFVANMKKVVRPSGNYGIPPAKFDDDFGTLLQFVSTMLLYKVELGSSLHPRVKELVPKLKEWKKTYKNSPTKTIRNASERLVDQIEATDSMMATMMRKMQEQGLVCGVATCNVTEASQLTVCSTCKIQRYCGRDHQKADWKYHKHICKKGLVEPAAV